MIVGRADGDADNVAGGAYQHARAQEAGFEIRRVVAFERDEVAVGRECAQPAAAELGCQRAAPGRRGRAPALDLTGVVEARDRRQLGEAR